MFQEYLFDQVVRIFTAGAVSAGNFLLIGKITCHSTRIR
ncbi:MAG: hypothetical protein BWX60_00618 [Candidatus Marinimicrobia bacterium ADurb.Bin030]|nr:MAG: hypothetical protein BWX60_00618 [Candidatus Marinimicrobia bacterium ADurb.Bin030]